MFLLPRAVAVSPATAIPSAGLRPATVRAAASVRTVREADARPDLLLVCVAAYLLTAVGRVHQLFPVLEILRPAALTGAVAILLYLLDSHPLRRSRHLFGSTSRYLSAFVLWAVLSVPGSLFEGNSFDLVFNNLIKTAVMFFIIAGAVRGVRDVERLAGAYFLSVAVYAAVVIWRFGGGMDWRLGTLYYYDANDFATLAVTAMPLGLYFLHTARRPSAVLGAALGLAAVMIAFVWSGSRGGFIAFVSVAAFLVLRYRGISFRWRVCTIALTMLMLGAVASEQYWNQMRLILSDADYNRTEETGRLRIWSRGIGYMLEYPVLGVGPNNFPVAEGTLSPHAERQQLGIGVRWNAAHNTFIQVGAELGIPGLLLFAAMIATALGALRRSRGMTGDGGASHLRLALMASLIGFVVGSVFLSLAYSEMLYTLLALAVAFHKAAAASR
jgi:O-antigen ligase